MSNRKAQAGRFNRGASFAFALFVFILCTTAVVMVANAFSWGSGTFSATSQSSQQAALPGSHASATGSQLMQQGGLAGGDGASMVATRSSGAALQTARLDPGSGAEIAPLTEEPAIQDNSASNEPSQDDAVLEDQYEEQDPGDNYVENDGSDDQAELTEQVDERIIETSLQGVDGNIYVVRISYDDFAGIPEGSQLKLVELNQSLTREEAEDPANRNRPYETERFVSASDLLKRGEVLDKYLELQEGDWRYAAKYLDVKLVDANGAEVVLAAPVEMTIETTFLPVQQGGTLELAWQFPVTNPTPEDPYAYERMDLDDKTDEVSTKASFLTDHFGELAVAGVARTVNTWDVEGTKVYLLGAKTLKSVDLQGIEVDSGKEGWETREAYVANVDPSPWYGTTMWLSAKPAEASSEGLGFLRGFRVRDGVLAGKIFAQGGTTEPVAFRADEEGFAFVWDTGYRRQALGVGNVTVEGMMPQGTELSAKGMRSAYPDPTELNEGLTAQAEDEGVELATAAAYDISLASAGQDYQPGEGTPVTVSITSVNINEGGSYQVWHVLDDGTVEVVEGATVVGNTITFEATGFSVYLVVSTTTLTKTLTASDGNTYQVTVTYEGNAGIPADAELEVSEIREGDKGYEGYVSAGAEAVGATPESVTLARAFDIKLRDPKTGEECRPTKPVAVSIRLLDESVQEGSEISVVHFPDETGMAAQAEGGDGGSEVLPASVSGDAVEFETSGFSVYVIVQTIKEQILEASDGKNYKVTVEYDSTCGIPMDAELQVSELNENDPYFTEYVSRSNEILGKDEKNLKFAHAFDISLVDTESGEKYQPNKNVKVSIELLGEELSEDEDLAVVHFKGDVNREVENEGENGENINRETGKAEVLTSVINGETIEFETGSFSAFTVTSYTVDFHWGDYTYNLEGGSTIFLSELLETLQKGHEKGSLDAENREKDENAENEGNDESVVPSVEEPNEDGTSSGSGSAGVYDTTKLQAILDDMSQIKSVTFSNPELVKIEQVNERPASVSDEIEEDDETDEALIEASSGVIEGPDWLITSLEPFDTEEILTITMKDGSTLELTVTDARVTIDGVTYYTHGANEARVVGLSAGATLHRTFEYGGQTYTVTEIDIAGSQLRDNKNTMDWTLVSTAAGYDIDMPEIKTEPSVAELASVDGFVEGTNNTGTNAADQKVWKQATYDEATNSIQYTLKYFQPMKENVPLDFIFVYDDSVTMYTGDRWAPGSNNRKLSIREAQGTRIMIQAATHALLSAGAGYDIRVALAGASSGDNRKSGWLTSYDQVTDYLATYNTGATSHTIGVNNALTLATESKNTTAANGEKRTPIVIYLSDFKDGAYNETTANQLHNIADVYALATTQDRARRRAQIIASDADKIFAMSEITDGVKALENIIWDAIGYYMKDQLKVTDELSDPLSGRTVSALNSDATDTANTTRTPTASNGKVTWDLSGSVDSSGNLHYLKAGQMYQETFTVALDPNKVYSGSMPTNNEVKVTGKNGEELNSISSAQSPTLHEGVDFILGMLKKDGTEDTATKFSGVKFTLTDGTTSKDYTTSANSAFTVPLADFVFLPGTTYTLTQDQATTPTAEGSTNRVAIANPMTWKLTVNADYTITAAKVGADTDMTISSSQFHIWNNEYTEPPLTKIFIEKNWDTSVPSDLIQPITFTVKGVKTSDNSEVALPAYSGSDRSTATPVTQITGGGSYTYTDSNGDEQTVTSTERKWVLAVWVPKYLENDGDIKSYTIEEGALPEVGGSTGVIGVKGKWDDAVVDVSTLTDNDVIPGTTHEWENVTNSTNGYNYVYIRPSSAISNAQTLYLKYRYTSSTVDYEYEGTITFNNASTLSEYTIIRFRGPAAFLMGNITLQEVKINGTKYSFTKAKSTASADVTKGKIAISRSTNNLQYDIDATASFRRKLPDTPDTTQQVDRASVSITNSFTPYNVLSLQSSFTDNSADSASTGKINKVKYTLVNNTTGAEITTPAVTKNTDGTWPEMKIYVPDGSYTAYQDYYTVDGFGNVASDNGTFAAYTTTSQIVTSDGTVSGAASFNNTIDKNTTVTFTNARKVLPTTVKAEWLRTEDDPEPKEGSTLYTDGLPYTLSYKVYGGNATPQTGTVKGTTNPKWQSVYGDVPSYSVDGSKTALSVDASAIDTLLQDYDTEVTRDDSDPNKVVFTITNTLRRGRITVSKEWALGFEDTIPTSVTVTITKEDGTAITGSPFTLNDDNHWKIQTDELPTGQKYTVTETAVTGTGVSISDYTVSYAQEVEQENPNYDSNDPDSQQYIMVPKSGNANIVDLKAGGAVVEITNSKYICKIVDGEGDEHPFTKLTDAVKYARDNKLTLPMDSTHPVAIEMLVDYVIPSADNVTLDEATDNIIITTAATSGGVYNFAPTFTSEQGRSDADSASVAILQRGWNQSGDTQALFYVNNASAKLRTADITLDGAYSTASQHTGRAVYVKSGDVCFTGGTTVRNFHTKAAGGAVYVGNGGNHTLIDNSSNGNVVFSNCGNEISSNNDDGAAICIQSGNLIINNSGAGTVLFEKIDGCAQCDGGAIGVAGGTITLNNTSTGSIRFVDCIAQFGGALETDGGNITFNNSGTGTMEFLRCYTDIANEGGAIYCGGKFSAVNNSTITFTGTVGTDAEANTKTTNGGAIYVNSSAVDACSITGSGQMSFANCKANTDGGAVYAKGGVTINQTGGTSFTNCVGNNGGGVYGYSTVSVTNGSFTGCTASTGTGGGIYSANQLSVSVSAFTDCSAKTYGGAIYIAGPDAGSHTIEKCTFDGHTNPDVDTVNAANGGAIYVNNGWLTITESQFSDLTCTANGGAVYMDGQTSDALTIEDCTFDGHDTLASTVMNASTGGAVYMNANNGITLKNLTVSDCWTSGNGGGVYADDAIISTEGTISFTDCYTTGGNGGGAYFANTADLSGATAVTFKGCHADSSSTSNGGGGVWFNKTATLNNSEFEDCYAGGNGGAMYFVEGGTLTNVNVDGHKTLDAGTNNAVKGGAIFLANSKTLTIKGGEIKNCSASDANGANGGAINVGGSGAVLNFEGNAVVYGNPSTTTASGSQKNVVLDQNYNTVIQTTGTGLGANAHIGVYVTGNNANPYNSHGKWAQPFGTATANDEANLEGFTNDRDETLFGVNASDMGQTGNLIYWGRYICKIEDQNTSGKKADGRSVYEHPFGTLNKALAYARSGASPAMSSSNAVSIQMLVDYVIPSTDNVKLDQAKDNIVITTAEKSGGVYNFVDTQAGKADADKGTAILKRGDFTNASLFDATDASAKIAFRKIILDGDNKTVTVPGGLVHSAGTVEVQSGTTMRNTKSSGRNSDGYGGGGAIWAKDVAINDNIGTIRFDNCFANFAGGAIYYTHHFDMNNNTGSITFNNCSMDGQARGDGGAISNWVESDSGQYFSATNNSGSIEFINCHAKNDYTQGGAIFQHHGGNITLASTGNGSIRFSGCYAGAGGDTYCGGAISAWDSNVTISLTGTATSPIVFENCHAETGNGGAIYTPGNVVLTNIYFNGCYAKTGNGGAIYTKGNVVLTNVRFGGYKTDANGNYVDSDGNTLSSGEEPVVDSDLACRAAGSGGAVYADGSVTYTSTAGATYTGCYGCYGSSGGAIYAGSTVNINENGGTLNFENCHSSGTGGAIYASSVSLNDNSGTLNFENCHSSGTGGAIYAGSTVNINENGGTLNFENCHSSGTGGAIYTSSVSLNDNSGTLNFDGCYTTGSGAHGGAIRADNDVTMNSNSGNIKFKDCHSGTTDSGDADGGAIAVYARGKTFSATDNTGTISFENCTTSAGTTRQGGAIILLGGTITMASTGSGSISFKDCYADAGSDKLAGGAISVWDGSSTITLTGTVEHPIIFEGCHTNGAGGAIVNNNSGTMNLTCVSFDDCYAEGTNGNGGAVYTNGTLNMTNVNITGHSGGTDGLAVETANANLGGAVYSGGNLTIKQSGTGTSEIKNCSASGNNGGAVNVTGDSTTMTFEGNVVVYGNTNTTYDTDHQHNVVLEKDNSTTILTSATGLGADAHVGIYVIGGMNPDSGIYANHGGYEDDFGTVNGSDASKLNLERFTNDRNGMYGVLCDLTATGHSHQNIIRWQSYLCKLTDDANGNLLYKDTNGRNAAVYNTLTEAFNALKGVGADGTGTVKLYNADGTEYEYTAANAIRVEMLRDYIQPGSDRVTDTANRVVTLKTAATSENGADIYIYNPEIGATGENRTKATITRGANGTSAAASMITLNTGAKELILTGIILDGDKTNYQPEVNGGIVNVAAGTLSVTTGAKLQNSKVVVDSSAAAGTTGLGGAVYVAPNATMNLNAGTISGNGVASTGFGAGIYLPEGSTLNISGSPSFSDNTKDETLSGKTNGGEAYTTPKQDIYIAGYIGTDTSGDPVKATSLKVTGELTNENGANDMSIWVWADDNTPDTENNHFKQLKQFAVFDLPTGATLSDDQKASTMKVFRNAVPDDLTEGSEALYGQFSDDDNSSPKVYIYWSGVSGYRKVILRKVEDSTYKSIEGAVFTIHKGNSNDAYKLKGETTSLSNLDSKASGVFWIGTLPYGVYYLHETTVPDGYTGHGTSEGRWFYLVIGDDTVAGSRDGVVTSKGYGTRDEAKAAYDNWKAANDNTGNS